MIPPKRKEGKKKRKRMQGGPSRGRGGRAQSAWERSNAIALQGGAIPPEGNKKISLNWLCKFFMAGNGTTCRNGDKVAEAPRSADLHANAHLLLCCAVARKGFCSSLTLVWETLLSMSTTAHGESGRNARTILPACTRINVAERSWRSPALTDPRPYFAPLLRFWQCPYSHDPNKPVSETGLSQSASQSCAPRRFGVEG